MASSGVSVCNDVAPECQRMQLDRKYRYLIFHIGNNLTEIQILKKADKSATYDDFINDMKEAEEKQECRYAVYDFEYDTETGGRKDKLVFFLWCPGTSKVRQKMVYTTSKDAIKKALNTSLINIQATDHDELDKENVLAEIKKTDKA